MENQFFVAFGALQAHTETGLVRMIECETSELDAVKIPEMFARDIASALNAREKYLPIVQAVAMLGEGMTISRDLATEAQKALQ